jgi:hypothetical protein
LPKYIFVHKDSSPEIPANLVHSFETINLYEVESVLPYSFLVESGLVTNREALTPDLVTAVDAEFHGPNILAMSFVAENSSTVAVALESYYPGWSVYIDGQKGDLIQVGDYLGVRTISGYHEYEFRFEPMSFRIGLLITCLAVIFSGWYAYRGIKDD